MLPRVAGRTSGALEGICGNPRSQGPHSDPVGPLIAVGASLLCQEAGRGLRAAAGPGVAGPAGLPALLLENLARAHPRRAGNQMLSVAARLPKHLG
jgi:hypothetical protein